MAFPFSKYDQNVRLLMNRVRTLAETMRRQTGHTPESVGQEVKLFVPTLVLALRNH